MHPDWPDPDHVARLAARVPPEIRFGTSSWTYPGWRGLVYQRDYPVRGSSARQLAEYAQWPLFRTVGIDSFYYAPPTGRALHAYAEALPDGFPCVSKVWERVTAYAFTSPRHLASSGNANPDWLNAGLFIDEVLAPMREHFADHMGPLVFELTAVPRAVRMSADMFAQALDTFLAQLPPDARYAVEIRNPEFLAPSYFAVLRDHRVAHVFNSWSRMPAIGEQLTLHDSITTDFIVARALLRPGRTYAQAVEAFAPYDRIQEENPAVRRDLVALARAAINLRIPAHVIVNNRLEGCSPLTIAALAAML
jgi:uncharacterized protein YecE (DUF72 family)